MAHPILFSIFIISLANMDSCIKFNEDGKLCDTEDDAICNKTLIVTPYIEAGEVEKAQKLAQVHPFENVGNVLSYSGFFTVNRTCNSNLFFWFFPSVKDYENAPVTLWLQGGPERSSLLGLFQEIGPFYVNHENKLELRNYTWNSVSSLLFIDNPVGAGYSFTDKDECYPTNEDDVRRDLYSALIQFFKMFPRLQKNDFFIFGQSYAGKYIPAIAYKIHENNPTSELKINLKGLGIGNGFSDPANMMVYSDYLYQLGLVDELGKKKIHELEEKTLEAIKKSDWSQASELFFNITAEISALISNISLNNFAKMDTGFECPHEVFVNKNTTRYAIHVGNVHYDCINNDVLHKFLSDMLKSVKPWIEKLLENYRILFYNGQFDIIVAFPLTRNFVNKLNWSGAAEFSTKERHPFKDKKNNVCGYIKSYRNLNLGVVRTAGHSVPVDQPECAYKLYENFISGKELWR